MASKDALTVYTGLMHGHIPIVTMTTVYTGLMHGHIPIVTTLTVYTGLTHGHIPIVTTLTESSLAKGYDLLYSSSPLASLRRIFEVSR